MLTYNIIIIHTHAGTPVCNKLTDLKNLVVLLARKEQRDQRAGYLDVLSYFEEWPDMDLHFILQRQMKHVEKQLDYVMQGEQST